MDICSRVVVSLGGCNRSINLYALCTQKRYKEALEISMSAGFGYTIDICPYAMVNALGNAPEPYEVTQSLPLMATTCRVNSIGNALR